MATFLVMQNAILIARWNDAAAIRLCGWCRESKLTQLIKECLSSSTNRVCMIAHVSAATHAYNETLQVLQLASRIHRLRTRRKTSKVWAVFTDYRRWPHLLSIYIPSKLCHD